MDKLENLLKDLQCPILLDLLEDPIRSPCCNKAFSRLALDQSIHATGKCPACNADLADFDALHVPKDIILAGMVDSVKAMQGQIKIEEKPEQNWSCSLIPIIDPKMNSLPVAQLTLSVEKAQFKTKPTLFLAVVDRSTSMAGTGWRQIQAALTHILALAKTNPNVKVMIIAYQSNAEIVNIDPNMDPEYTIKALNAGGGTNFRDAFDKTRDVLQSFTCSDLEEDLNKPNNVGSVTIAFMTDGQDGSNLKKNELAPYFKDVISTSWNGPVTVHSVGFTAGCDKDLLEQFRLCGNIEGTFRYAEPGDDDDALCQKLQGIFLNASDACSVKLALVFPETLKLFGSEENKLEVRFPVGANKRGSWSTWITGDFENLGHITLNSDLDKDRQIAIIKKEYVPELFTKWIAFQIDGIAAELFRLCKVDKEGYGLNLFDLHCALIQQKIDAMSTCISDQTIIARLNILGVQVENLRQGNAVNLGKLADLRFGSQFATIQSKPKAHVPVIADVPGQQKPLAITEKSEWKEKIVSYSHNNTGKNRNSLGEAIMSKTMMTKQEVKAYVDLLALVDNSTIEDMVHRDINGNTPLMLASYCGHSPVVEKMLEKFPTLDVHSENEDKETALTLAIKKRGFWRVMKALLKADATIPEYRKKALEQFCINAGFELTAKMIASASADVRLADPSMQPAYIKFMYELAKEKNKEIDADSYLNSALSHCMHEFVENLLKNEKVTPTIQMLMTHCIPPKPDDPETPKYLRLAEMILDHSPHLINEVDENEESALFKACEKGSRPHVVYFLERGAVVDQPNNLGNTPLWISCAKAYPCIIDELLNWGADVDWKNKKGNVPMYSLCQKGPKKIVETLLARGATVDGFNENGDTLLLISTRNGQHEILELLLKYVEPEFVDFRAKIDGFNCVFASVEADRPECIRVLKEYGANFEQKTDHDNQILPNATPLHLATFYGRSEACRMLLNINVKIDSVDHNGQTPLHFAVIQGHIPVIKMLRNAGANINIKDVLNNTPASYCRNRHDIRKVLVDPALDSLINLARGQFSKGEEAQACELLRHNTGVIGCLAPKDAVDLISSSGTTPFIEAIIHSNYDVAKTLATLGADPSIRNMHGVTGYSWAKWINNPRIKKLLVPNSELEQEAEKSVARLREAQRLSTRDAFILFLTSCPKEVRALQSSGVSQRMETGLSTIKVYRDQEQATSNSADSFGTDRAPKPKTKPTALSTMFTNKEFTDPKSENLVWNAKVFTVSLIASGEAMLSPQEIFALCLYTNNSDMAMMITEATVNLDNARLNIFEPFISTLNRAYHSMPPFSSEVYLATNELDRTMFQIGAQFSWPTFRSASTMWRVALDHVPSFDDKTNKKGTVFVIKSKTGRLMVRYSQFSYDGEVLIAPSTQFKVTNWYRGDVIALGQANIREYTFKLKDEEKIQMMHTNKSLIIEIEEI